MKRILVALVSLSVLLVGWFFVSPLFIDVVVNEDPDFVTANGEVMLERIRSMPDDERVANKDDIMAAAAAAPDQPVTDTMPASAPRVVARGEFVDADVIHKGSGHATVYALPDGRHVVRLDDFRTTNGPALVVYLAVHPAPSVANDVTDSGFVRLGKLKGNVGNQNYPVPADVDVTSYGSVVIWCELFGVLFSPASLSKT